MKAIIKKSEQPGLEYAELPEKAPGAGWVKIRVFVASICGTDIHYNRWDATAQNFKDKFNITTGKELSSPKIFLCQYVKLTQTLDESMINIVII